MLTAKNGFYAFAAALHVLPSACSNHVTDTERWNSQSLWKNGYEGLGDYWFFAEDAFGEQFGLHTDGIYRFDPETADIQLFAESLEGWARKLLENYEVETGYPLCSQWQALNGALPLGKRLVPKTPFILGGEFSVSNLYALDSVEAMHYRADIWNQIKDLPEGTKLKLRVTGLPGKVLGH